jgi:hypothetical protein
MALSVMINLDDLLFAAYNLGFTSDRAEPSLTKAELRAKILSNVPLVGCTEPKTASDSTEEDKPAAKPKTEKKPREIKPKAVVEFCCARAFYEKEHVEEGKLKKMSDDETNEFGGRCKFKQSGESTFCKHHAGKQPHGVWGGEYAGKLKSLIEKANAPVAEPKAAEDKPKAEEPKPKAVKKIVKKVAAAPAADDEAPKTPTKPKTKVVKPNAPKRPAKEEESDVEEDEDDEYLEPKEAGNECEWIEIDDISYTIDAEGNVRDPETEEKVGPATE